MEFRLWPRARKREGFDLRFAIDQQDSRRSVRVTLPRLRFMEGRGPEDPKWDVEDRDLEAKR